MSQTGLNLLVASSADTSAAIHQALVGSFPGCYLHQIENREALSDALKNDHWHLMISEMEHSDFSANEFPQIFKRHGLNLPVALIAEPGCENLALDCLAHETCHLIQCSEEYIHLLPATVTALLKRAERKQQQLDAEQQYIEKEERYLDIFNNTSDLIQSIAPDGSFLYTNKAWRKAMGYSRDEVAELNLLDVLHPDSQICCQDRFEKLKRGEKLATIDFKFLTRQGETLHLIGNCGSMMKDGDVISTRGIFKNVTATILAEQALKESEERFQILYDMAPDIYTTIDSRGELLSINQTGLDALGYTRTELLGRKAIISIHEDDQEKVLAFFKNIFLTGTVSEDIEFRKIRKDGSEFWVHCCVRFDQHGNEPRLLVVSRDITIRRELQEKLQFHASHDSLTHLINRRELEARLSRVLAEMSEQDNHMLCFMDLDEFKRVNDENGHAAGDEMLKQVTSILHKHVRSRDTLARIGGDEFVILMEHCPQHAAVKLSEKIKNLIADFKFQWRAEEFSIGVSIGITGLKKGLSIEEVLKMADDACYTAKKNGRNCIYVEEAD